MKFVRLLVLLFVCMQPCMSTASQSWWNLSRYVPTSLGQWWQTTSVKNIPWYVYGMMPQLSTRQKVALGALGATALSSYLLYNYFVAEPERKRKEEVLRRKEEQEKDYKKWAQEDMVLRKQYELEAKKIEEERHKKFKENLKNIISFKSAVHDPKAFDRLVTYLKKLVFIDNYKKNIVLRFLYLINKPSMIEVFKEKYPLLTELIAQSKDLSTSEWPQTVSEEKRKQWTILQKELLPSFETQERKIRKFLEETISKEVL